jgi:hypothetical protein
VIKDDTKYNLVVVSATPLTLTLNCNPKPNPEPNPEPNPDPNPKLHPNCNPNPRLKKKPL